MRPKIRSLAFAASIDNKVVPYFIIYASGSQPVGRDPKRGRDTNAMGSLIDFDPNVNII